jgi:hypothetical protein
MVEMDEKTEGTLAIVAAFFVLFSAMVSAEVSLALSVVFLVALAAYKFLNANADQPKPVFKKKK